MNNCLSFMSRLSSACACVYCEWWSLKPCNVRDFEGNYLQHLHIHGGEPGNKISQFYIVSLCIKTVPIPFLGCSSSYHQSQKTFHWAPAIYYCHPCTEWEKGGEGREGSFVPCMHNYRVLYACTDLTMLACYTYPSRWIKHASHNQIYLVRCLVSYPGPSYENLVHTVCTCMKLSFLWDSYFYFTLLFLWDSWDSWDGKSKLGYVITLSAGTVRQQRYE